MLADLIGYDDDFIAMLFQLSNAAGKFLVGNAYSAVDMSSLKLSGASTVDHYSFITVDQANQFASSLMTFRSYPVRLEKTHQLMPLKE